MRLPASEQEHKLQETHLAEVEADLRELAPSHTAHWAVSVPPAKSRPLSRSITIWLVANDLLPHGVEGL